MKDWKKNWWDPFWYLGAVWQTFTSIVGAIFRAFGFNVGPRPQHENIHVEDVNDAFKDAAAAEALPETFGPEIDSKVNGFFRYVQMSPEERASTDLSPFTADEQDFILGLTQAQLDVLRERGSFGALQAILIRRIPQWPSEKTAPEMKPEPSKSKAEQVKEAIRSRVRGLAEDASDGLDFAPMAIR